MSEPQQVVYIPYHPWPHQRDFHKRDSRFTIVVAGRRAGKSTCGVHEAVRKALSKPEQLIWWLSPTYSMARDIAFSELLRFQDQLQPYISKINMSSMTTEFLNGSKIMFKSADSPSRLRGRGIDHLYIDEAAYVKKEIWMTLRPALGDKKGTCTLFSSPNGQDSWFYDIWAKDNDWKKYHWVSSLSPLMTPDELDSIKKQMSQREYDQEIEATFLARAGQVYPDFTEANEVEGYVIAPDDEIAVGMDFGYAGHTAIAFMAYNAKNDKITQFDEIYVNRTQLEEILDTLKSKLDLWGIRKDRLKACYVDPAGEAPQLVAGLSPTDLMRSPKYEYNVVCKATKINPGLALVRSYILNAAGQRRFFISKKCPETIRSMRGYIYNTEQTNQEIALKDGITDHACDAVRYYFVNRFDSLKYVGTVPSQESYTQPQSKGKCMKRCGKCRRPFFSSTPKHLPPYTCDSCK